MAPPAGNPEAVAVATAAGRSKPCSAVNPTPRPCSCAPGAGRERPSWREPRSPATPRVEGSGRTVDGMPDPQPQALHQPSQLLSRPTVGSFVESG